MIAALLCILSGGRGFTDIPVLRSQANFSEEGQTTLQTGLG
jgi:hypothetical protein